MILKNKTHGRKKYLETTPYTGVIVLIDADIFKK